MDKIQLHDKFFVPCIPNEEILKFIDELAAKLNADFNGCVDVPIILCILNGSIPFTGELLQRINFPCQVASTKMTSYVGTSTTGEVKQDLPLTCSVKDRRVIIVEDIVDSGYTIQAMKKILEREGASETRVCTLLFKPGAYKTGEKIDYIGKEIPNDFIVGFGLDYDELGRNLPDIYILEQN